MLAHVLILLYKGERVVIGRLTQRDDHFTGSEYFAILPSPDDFPLILRHIQGIKKTATQDIFTKTLIILFCFLAAAGGTFQFGSKLKPNPSRTAFANLRWPSEFICNLSKARNLRSFKNSEFLASNKITGYLAATFLTFSLNALNL
jgi:hypothetical protein